MNTISNKLVQKIIVSFLLLLLIVGISYVLLTAYFSNKYFEEVSQKLNAHLATHLIEEKFQNASPFLENGEINKPLFGDLMHDMMAVNRGIEVYLLSETGEVRYSVVLDHERPDRAEPKVDLGPVQAFIDCEGERYILGDDPLDPTKKKIFSAASFDVEGTKGYIYIILASQQFERVTSTLAGSYFLKLGLGTSLIALLFTGIIGVILIWYLTGHLREIIQVVTRFKEGDMKARIKDAKNSDLSTLAVTFNDMADTIIRNIEELQSVEKLRRELVSNVSHDLRTPLAIMQGYIETLQLKSKTLTDQERDQYFKIIQNSAEKLGGLINQLFEYSKLEAKQIEPQKEPFQISELANDVYLKYQKIAEQRKISIELEAEENLPFVFGDIGLIERIIQNLMDNALKFTPEDGEVIIELKSDSENVFISIKNTGPGIPQDEQPYIFERFTKATSGTGNQNGAGLGLAIVKKIVELHESTIKVISKPNQGTVFSFNLPRWADQPLSASTN